MRTFQISRASSRSSTATRRSPTRSRPRSSASTRPALYGIEPITGPCDLTAEEIEAIRASLPPARTYGPTTIAEAAAMIAAHQGGYAL